MSRTKWLKCAASEGQFTNELAVYAADHEGSSFSLFASREHVKLPAGEPAAGEEVEAMLKVTVLDQRGDLCLIRLPGRAFENGSTVTVRAGQLEDSVREYA
jgi:hypothetical protein